MKKLLLIGLLLATRLLGVNAEVDPNFYIYICFGQSNMEGNAQPEDVDKTGIDDRFRLLATCNFTNPQRTTGNWYKAVPPLVNPIGGLGPTDYFGRTMVENLPKSVRIGVIPVAMGGSPIEMFDKDLYQQKLADNPTEWWATLANQHYGGNPYGRIIEMAKKAQQVGVIKGILLHQGCTNNGDPNWPDMVKKIYNDMLTDLSLNTADVPLFVGETLRQEQGGACYAHNAQIARMPSVIANSYVISSEGCTGNGTDPWHFNAAGYRKLGRRYAAAALKLMGITISDTPSQSGKLASLHVEGKWLVDTHGNHVVLHGVMDTPSMWFNGYLDGSNNHHSYWSGGYNATGAANCLNYFEKVFTALEQANCDVFRLHLDPAWTNDPNSNYTYSGSVGQSSDAKDEADIRKFNPERLKTFMESVYYPLMQKAMNHGMYVVVRPPGVCPGDLKVGDYYQQYLMTVWDYVSSYPGIQQYAGQISLELANEPVRLKDKNNQENKKALHDYFQPIVEKIRENGFTGIIWIPGTGWQSNYRDYVDYPIEDNNYGYAVHDYTGWYGCSDANPDPQNKINNFHYQVPVVDNYPVIITEVDWSPEKEGSGHYNEHGEWVTSNYGTWSTGTTSKWGRAYKAMLDHFENISMTLSGTGCLIDIDELINNNKVTAAFGGLEEACGKACMRWYAEYKGVPFIDDGPSVEGFGEEITSMDYITAGNRFMIGNGTNVLYFETDQNAISQPVTDLPLETASYYYTLTKINGYDDVYAVNIVNKNGTPFPAPYNLGSNINESIYNIIFSGSARIKQGDDKYNYGTDGENMGIWHINYTDGEGFTFCNVGSGRYMNMTGLADNVVHMRLYKGVKISGEDAANDQIFAMSKAIGYDANTGMLTGGWRFDEPVDISDWDYLMIMTSITAADDSHSVVITDANNKEIRGEGYIGSETGTGGKMWLDQWNNQNAIRISINYLKNELGLDVTRIKALEFKAWGTEYVPVGVSCVYLTDYNNTKVNGGYADGDVVREYSAGGSFGTICLPYRAAVAGARVYKIVGANGSSIGLDPVEGLLEPGIPYIYIGADMHGKDNAGQVCNVNFFRADLSQNDVTVPVAANGLVGTFTATTVPQGDDFLVLKNGKLYYTTGATVSLGANKAYIDRSKIQNVAEGRLFLGYDAPTGINTVETIPSVAFYDLQGRRTSSPVAKGIYVVRMANGKNRKIMIK